MLSWPALSQMLLARGTKVGVRISLALQVRKFSHAEANLPQFRHQRVRKCSNPRSWSPEPAILLTAPHPEHKPGVGESGQLTAWNTAPLFQQTHLTGGDQDVMAKIGAVFLT